MTSFLLFRYKLTLIERRGLHQISYFMDQSGLLTLRCISCYRRTTQDVIPKNILYRNLIVAVAHLIDFYSETDNAHCTCVHDCIRPYRRQISMFCDLLASKCYSVSVYWLFILFLVDIQIGNFEAHSKYAVNNQELPSPHKNLGMGGETYLYTPNKTIYRCLKKVEP